MSGDVRQTAVAGLFYPAQPGVLHRVVVGLLAGARQQAPRNIRAIVAPHAGYIYSGTVAGEAFHAIVSDKGRYRRVVLIGPAHHVGIEGIAVSSAMAFATPLGALPLDRTAVELLSELPQVVTNDAAHAPEHCLEVELPFVFEVLGPLPIIPLLVGRASDEEVAAVLDRLWDEATLVILSTDLSHYQDDAGCRRSDAATAAHIVQLQRHEIGAEDACGYRALRGLLLAAERRGYRVSQLALLNSGAASGETSRVVGYGAFAITGEA